MGIIGQVGPGAGSRCEFTFENAFARKDERFVDLGDAVQRCVYAEFVDIDLSGAVETVVSDFDRRTGCRQFCGERDWDGFSVAPTRSGFIRRRIGGASAEESQSGRRKSKSIDYAVHKFDDFN